LSASPLADAPDLQGQLLWLEGSLANGRLGAWTAAIALSSG
jgi:hypothetical protein